MKKALLYGLSAVMLVSLTACGTAQANQPDEPPPMPTPSAVQTEPPQETPAPENTVEPLSAVRELTDEELEEYFRTAYDFVGITYDGTKYNVDDRIKEEISFLASLITDDGKLSPEYENKYMAWRPAEPSQGDKQTQQGGDQQTSQGETQQTTQGNSTQTQQGGNQQTQQGGNQQTSQGEIQQATQGNSTQTQQGGNQQTQQGGTQQTPQSGNSGGPSYYNGFSTYEEYIADIHRQYPEYSIEQIKETFPDPAGIHVDQDVVNQDIKDGRLNGN